MNKREVKRRTCGEVATEIENIIELAIPPRWIEEDTDDEVRWDEALQELADEMRQRAEK